VSQSTKQLLQHLFDTMIAKDTDGMLKGFHDDAVLYDPHYPVPLMEGKPAIKRGLDWAMGVIVQPGFTITKIWEEDGIGLVEVATDHLFKGGKSIQFEQVFRFEIEDDKISRFVAFTPHGPPGIGGLMAALTGWWWKLTG